MNGLKPIISGKIFREKHYCIYAYKPTASRLFYEYFGKMTLQSRIRFLLELIKGYEVFYLETDNELVAYCVISKGGGRYSFAGKTDIVVGPYYVSRKHRGNHYSELLISEVLQYDGLQFDEAYDWIKKTNTPSLKCSDALSLKITGTADVVKPFRRIVLRNDDSGEYYILKAKREDLIAWHRHKVETVCTRN